MIGESSSEKASERGTGPCILCFDGSDPARRAIRETAGLLGRVPAVVVHVWDRPSGLMLGGRQLAATHPLAPAAEALESTVLGSVAHGIANHWAGPVIIVPATDRRPA